MNINKDKVEVITRKDINQGCNCNICQSEILSDKVQGNALEEVKRILTEYVQTTGMEINGLNIQLYFPGQEPLEESPQKNRYTTHIISLCEKIEIKAGQFSKKYRHALICLLNSNAKKLRSEATIATVLMNQSNYDDAMWRYTNVLKLLSDIKFILKQIQDENIFQDETISKLLASHQISMSKANIDARKMVNKALEIQPAYMASW